MSVFPVRASGDENVLKHIFPTKQADIQKLLEYVKSNSEIKKVIVFGSAVTWQCRPTNDIDIAVQYASDRKFADIAADLRKQMTSECDVVDYDDIHSVLLKQEIDKKGVLIYDGQNL